MAIQAVFTVFISSMMALSASQFCGSITDCTQQYDTGCPSDTSTAEYDNCRTTQSSCNQPLGPTDNLSVDCYDTCIVGVPATSMQCCANSVLAPETISVTAEADFVIARLFSPNSPGPYPSNRFCRYNVQCPNETFNLNYFLVRIDVEPPVNNQCLDFLRYEFSATGANVPTDACGDDRDSLAPALQSGPHSSSLMVNFRSNRRNTGMDFFLAITCTLPQELSLATNGQNSNDANTASIASFSAARPRSQGRTECTQTRDVSGAVVGADPRRFISARQYINRVFKGKFSSRIYRTITVSRVGVVLYKDNTVFVVYKGKVRYRFRNIKVLQVHNRIEGYLKFYGSASPRGRTFPGYGFLQVRRGIVQYVQTILDPRFLLNAEEESIVRQLHQELFIRERLGTKGGINSGRLQPGKDQTVNCSVNRLAQLNTQSCTAVVRAVATFFLKSDTFQEYCNSEGY